MVLLPHRRGCMFETDKTLSLSRTGRFTFRRGFYASVSPYYTIIYPLANNLPPKLVRSIERFEDLRFEDLEYTADVTWTVRQFRHGQAGK